MFLLQSQEVHHKKMRRASVFVVGVVITSLLVLTSAFGLMYLKYFKMEMVGEEQFLLMNAYLEGDKALLYMDTAAEYAYGQAAYWFSFNAGFYGESSCNIDGFNIINSKCDFNDDIIKENFNKYLNRFFNQYSKDYEDSYIPFNLYEFYERGDEIIGIAKHPVVVLIGSSNERIDCFPGLLQEFPVAGSYEIEDTWGSEQSPDSIEINVRNPNTAVIAVVDGKIKDIGKHDDEEFIEISSEQYPYKFHYSHLRVSNAMIKDGSVRAGDVIGSTSDYIRFKAYRKNIPMNPICSLRRIKKSNQVKGYYYVEPHTNFKPKYDIFDDFNAAMETAEEMISDCGNDIDCIKNNYNNKKIDADLVLHVGDCEGNEVMNNDVFGFCVNSNNVEKSFYVYDKNTKSIKLEPIKFKFALDLSKGFSAPRLSLAKAPTRPPGLVAPLRLGLIWPVKAVITSCFGYRPHPFDSTKTEWHGGVDFRCPEGTSVRAVADGEVYQTTYSTTGYGYNVVIKHTDSFFTRYSHLSRIIVGNGQEVKKGEVIALCGSTGRVTAAHLDFRIHFSSALSTAPEGDYGWDPFCFLPRSYEGYDSGDCKERECPVTLQ